MNKKVLIDKQALIDELMKIPGVGSNSDALETIKRFPSYEPQKPVMPKFFDDWAKQVLEKRDKFYAISLITRAGWGYGVDFELNYDRSPSGTKELLNWIVENEGDDYPNKKKATEALLYGYEVEKEPLYYVKLPVVYFNRWDLEAYLMKDDRGNITIADNNDFDDMKFTESEIKAIDEGYWPFAVPV
ncbi:DUF1642 domain-containing protein [Enterococcus faecium]|uniref:DUF1642 domain-containing protein n=1 Tax=Enterococcus faecium EnGen0026 TaxID=1138917 RepID=A0A829A5G0_ENTFC|nr:hypothetical protein OKA_04871 [Enterococcus faecium EnGen0026]ELB41943.1 hypothetical protein OKA_03131 [Enterococcus faecium EnGen0026]